MALSDNLQGWWCPSLDTAGNGTTTLTDLSGNSNNGTLTNMDAATDWVADTDSGGVRALDFDGSNDVVVTPTISLGSATGMSLSFWVKVDSWPASEKVVFELSANYNLTANSPAILVTLDASGCFRVSSRALQGYQQWKTAAVSTGQWVHVVATWDTTQSSSENRGYINGSVSGAQVPGNDADLIGGFKDNILHIGARSSAGNFGIDGMLDSVSLLTRLVSTSEITQLYNGGRSLNLLASGNIAHVLASIQQQQESVVVL